MNEIILFSVLSWLRILWIGSTVLRNSFIAETFINLTGTIKPIIIAETLYSIPYHMGHIINQHITINIIQNSHIGMSKQQKVVLLSFIALNTIIVSDNQIAVYPVHAASSHQLAKQSQSLMPGISPKNADMAQVINELSRQIRRNKTKKRTDPIALSIPKEINTTYMDIHISDQKDQGVICGVNKRQTYPCSNIYFGERQSQLKTLALQYQLSSAMLAIIHDKYIHTVIIRQPIVTGGIFFQHVSHYIGIQRQLKM
ncbi:Hypothetical_protein [Hexamita inflata]|uniref:Hypothetical_protein n=1 Tax=Hexamita inflata TaxID=28002 RepID=A0AA86R833_9EUKA|nr:Hypothetical protein HINF_LOCUS58887 [Hexamita inflata]